MLGLQEPRLSSRNLISFDAAIAVADPDGQRRMQALPDVVTATDGADQHRQKGSSCGVPQASLCAIAVNRNRQVHGIVDKRRLT